MILSEKVSRFPVGLFTVILFLIFTACNNDDNNLGLDIQPPNDKLNVVSVDTTTVTCYSQIVDSVKTDETSISLLGSLADPVFGVTTASIYTQFRLSLSAYDFGAAAEVDSLVLTLDYSNFYGDSAAAMTVKVYELSEQIEVDSDYYSHQSLQYFETLLAQHTFVPDFSNDVIIGTDTLDPHLRISLTDLTTSLAEKLITAPADSMADNNSFLNYFYGLYITAEPKVSGGSIIYFDLLSALSAMTLYYHNETSDTLSFGYTINANCGRFGNFTHDYEAGDPGFKAQVVDQDTAQGKNTCYIQAMGGVKTFIRFPYIKHYYDNGKIAVNEARFFMRCEEPEPELERATTLIFVKKKSDGGYDLLEDQLNGSDYFGGYYDKNSRGYWFRITSSIQDLMRSADTDYGYEIYLSGGAVNAERVLLVGSDPQSPEMQEDRMKLVLTYTILN